MTPLVRSKARSPTVSPRSPAVSLAVSPRSFVNVVCISKFFVVKMETCASNYTEWA